MELNREQIIKALECCSNNDECVGEACPYYATGCENNMPKDAISLIKELTEENERLRAEGEWIPIPEYENKRCSVCRTVFSDFTLGYYCPKCGAKMKGE